MKHINECHPRVFKLLVCIISYVDTTSSYVVLLRVTFVSIELRHIKVISSHAGIL